VKSYLSVIYLGHFGLIVALLRAKALTFSGMHSYPSAVIFDMDGLMIDTERLAFEVICQTAETFNLSFPLRVYKKLIGRSTTESVHIVKEEMGEDFPFEKVFPVWSANYLKRVQEGPLPVKEGLYELFDYLESKNIRKVVATSTAMPLAEIKLKKINAWDRFESVATADQVAKGKPAPDVYKLALKNLGLKASECMALEDSPNGIRAAYAAKIPVLMIPDILQPTDELIDKSEDVLPSLKSVGGYIEALGCEKELTLS